MKERLRRKLRAARTVAEKNFPTDERAQSMGMASNAVNLIVALTVGGIVAAFLIPVAINEIVNVDTTSWSSGAASLWDILDVIVVLAVFLFFIGAAMANRM